MSPRVQEDYKLGRRNAILDAALRCFKRKGYEGTTVAEILAEAGVSAGALYNYFEGKLDIYLSLAERDLEEDLRAYRRVLAEERDAWSKLQQLIRMGMIDFRGERRGEFAHLYLLEFLPASVGNDRLRRKLAERNRQLYDILREVLREGVEGGEFRPVDYDAVAALILAAGDGVRLHALTVGTLADGERIQRVFMDNINQILSPRVENRSPGG